VFGSGICLTQTTTFMSASVIGVRDRNSTAPLRESPELAQ